MLRFTRSLVAVSLTFGVAGGSVDVLVDHCIDVHCRGWRASAPM